MFALLAWNVLEHDYGLLLNRTLIANPQLPELEPDLVLVGLSNQSSTTVTSAVTLGGLY